MAPPAQPHNHTWQVRIRAAGEAGPPVVGAGIVLPGNRVLTCAHVVHNALRRRRPSPEEPLPLPGPADRVLVDNPICAPGWTSYATVIEEHWFTRGHRPSDIALLRLETAPPPALAPAVLGPGGGDAAASARVRALGYPPGAAYGRTTHAYPCGPGGDSPEKVQLTVDIQERVPVKLGFSGCGVLCLRTETVIGVLTSVDVETGTDGGYVAYMIPVEEIPPLRADISALPPRPFDELYVEMFAILAELDFPAVARCYAESIKQRRSAADARSFPNAWDAFTHLRDLPDTGGLPRSVVFVEEVARRQPPDAARRLRLWTDSHPEWSLEFGRAVGRIRGRSAAPSGPLSPPARLTIRADPADSDHGSGEAADYEVSHWLSTGPEDHLEVTPGETVTLPRSRLQEHALEVVADTENRLPSLGCTELRLEFVLPYPLLDQPIPDWRAPAVGAPGARLGARYPIVLGSWERRYDPRFRHCWRRWRNRWDRLHQLGKVTWIWPNPADGDTGMLADRLASDSVVAYVLNDPPDQLRGKTELFTALDAGLPVILFGLPNASAHNDDADARPADRPLFEQLPRSIVETDDGATAASGIISLPEGLRGLRTQAPNASAPRQFDPFRVALIYDYPGRVPEVGSTVRLRSPRPSELR